MAKLRVSPQTKEATLRAVIIRADGTRVELGTVAYYHRNPLRRLLYQVRRLLGRAS